MTTIAHQNFDFESADSKGTNWLSWLCAQHDLSNVTADDITALSIAFTESENLGALLGVRYAALPWTGDLVVLRNAVAQTGFEYNNFLVVAEKVLVAAKTFADNYVNAVRNGHPIESSVIHKIQTAAA